MTKLTIITPSYNQAEFIEQTILSVINQDYKNIEYLIFDGGSTDNTKEILEKYNSDITYWESKPDKGQSNAINKGLKMATGDIILWLNSDDYYQPNIFSTIVKTYEKNKDKAIFGRVIHHPINKPTYLSSYPIQKTTEKTAGFGITPQPSMFFLKKQYDEIGLLNEQLNCCMDLDWWLRFLLQKDINDIIQLDLEVVNFRFHTTSKSTNLQTEFETDRETIYYQLAKFFQLNIYANLLENLSSINNKYTLDIPKNATKIKAEKILTYYLLKRIDELYVSGEYDKLKNIITVLNQKLLEKEDLKYLRTILFKVKYIPKKILKYLKK